jgi:hypothetical protein
VFPVENPRSCAGKRLGNNRLWFCPRESTTLKGTTMNVGITQGGDLQTAKVGRQGRGGHHFLQADSTEDEHTELEGPTVTIFVR